MDKFEYDQEMDVNDNVDHASYYTEDTSAAAEIANPVNGDSLLDDLEVAFHEPDQKISVESTQEPTTESKQDISAQPDHNSLADSYKGLDLTQVPTADISDFQGFYYAYHTSFGKLPATKPVQMQRAKDLAFALLTHYFPGSAGYRVAPHPLGTIARQGLVLMLREPRETPKQVDGRDDLYWTYKNPKHIIEPQNITGFIVSRLFDLIDPVTSVMTREWYPHTYLTIVNDDTANVHKISPHCPASRGDILGEVLCGKAGPHSVRKGFGIMFFGPRLEFYKYDADANVNKEEESVTTCRVYKPRPLTEGQKKRGDRSEDWTLDMRKATLKQVDEAFQVAVGQEVVYMDDPVDEGLEAI